MLVGGGGTGGGEMGGGNEMGGFGMMGFNGLDHWIPGSSTSHCS